MFLYRRSGVSNHFADDQVCEVVYAGAGNARRRVFHDRALTVREHADVPAVELTYQSSPADQQRLHFARFGRLFMKCPQICHNKRWCAHAPGLINAFCNIAPVKAGARIRNRVVLLAVEPQDRGRFLLKFQNTVEIEDEKKPALIAEMLALLLTGN